MLKSASLIILAFTQSVFGCTDKNITLCTKHNTTSVMPTTTSINRDITILPSVCHKTKTVTLPRVCHKTKTVTLPPSTETVTETLPPLTETVTETLPPLIEIVTETLPPVTEQFFITFTTTETAPCTNVRDITIHEPTETPRDIVIPEPTETPCVDCVPVETARDIVIPEPTETPCVETPFGYTSDIITSTTSEYSVETPYLVKRRYWF
jgi:hypothetical protein